MTSTNDGKDVKSNQTSGQKGKIYYIELYKTLEAHLNADSDLRERTQHLCDAWRHIYTLCLHSAPSTHPHLFSWLQKHTAKTVLQSEWHSPKFKDKHAVLETAITNFIEECKSAISSRNGVSYSWECQLLQRADWFKNVLSNPWGHPVLKLLLDPTTKQPSDEEILEWLKQERGVMFVTRLRQLSASKCDDLAMALTTAVMDRARADAVLVADVQQSVEPPDKPGPQNIDTKFADILRMEAGFTSDIWELLTDIEFVLLHKLEKTSRCIELAKQTRLRIGYQLVERLRSRLTTSPREKKLWKNAKDVATLIAQVIIARCMVIPICAGVSRAALYCCTRSLAQLVTPARLPAVAAALAAPAATAKHLHTLASAMDAQRKDMKPFVCEMYVRAITAGMNELERLKLKTEKESEARSAAQILSTWFTQLGSLLSCSARIKCECALTAFSVYPSRAMYDQIRAAPPLPPVIVDAQELKPETTSEFGSWANDSRSKTNFVKTSETLNMKHTQQQANVLSTAILTEGEALGLSAELCQDLAVLLSGPRLKTLSWDMDRQLLLENCHMYVERTNGGTRSLTMELKYLNMDLSHFQHLPEEEEEDENDVYYGIEKGYEHLVELQEPEEIWQKDFFDSEETETANSCMEDNVQSVQTKKKIPLYVLSSEEDTDPLSLLADAKRTEKKKERPHSKERSKEHIRKSKSNSRDSSVNKEYSCERRKETSDGREKKKERKEKKRKEKGDKTQCAAPDPLTNLLGMKVAHMPSVIGEDRERKVSKKKGRRRKHRECTKLNSTSITDSDYDSQGKLSLASLNSEGNDQNVLFDGLFSMDDYKSPELPTQNSLTQTSKQNSSIQTDSIQQPSLCNSKELSISSGQVGFNNVDRTNLQSSSTFGQKSTTVSNLEPNTQKNTGLCNDVTKQNIMKLLQFRKNNSKASNVHCEVNNMVVNGNSSQNMFNSNPILTGHQPAKNASPMISSHPHTNMNDRKCLDSSKLNLALNKQSQKLTAVSSLQDAHVEGNVIQNYGNFGQNVSTQTKPTIPKPLQSYERVRKNLHQNEPTYIQKVVVENIPQFHSNKVDGNTLKQSSHSLQGNLIQNTIEQKSQSTETPHQKTFHDFLKGFQQTTDAGVVSDKSNKSSVYKQTVIRTVDSTPVNKPVLDSNIKRAEPTISPYSAKQVQQKKVENAPNTFARLSYMHKNKQNDMKTKQTIDQTPHKQLSEKELVSVELDQLVAEFKNSKYKNDLTISRITNPCQTESPKDNAQTLNRKHVKPSTSKSVIENSVISQTNHYKQPNRPSVLMQDPVSRMKTQSLNTPTEQTSKQLTITNKNTNTMLSERDQVDLLLLLRQQSRLNMPITTNRIAGSLQTLNNSLKNSATNSYNSMTSTNVVCQNRHSVEAQTNVSTMKIADYTQNFNIKTIQPQQNPSTNIPIASLEVNTTQKTALHTNIDPIKVAVKNVETNNTVKKLDWESVMNDLLAHKTPSRGPNALDLALNTNSARLTSDNSLRNQRIVRGESDKFIKPITDLRHLTTSKLQPQVSKQVRPAQNDVVIKQLPQNNIKQFGQAGISNHAPNSASHSNKTNLSTPRQPQTTKQQALHRICNKNKQNTIYIKQYKRSCAAKSTTNAISGAHILNTSKPVVSDSVKRQQCNPKAEPDKLDKVLSNVKLGQLNVSNTENPNRVIHSVNTTLRPTGSNNLKRQSLTDVLKKTSQIEVTKRTSTEFQKKQIPAQFTKDNDPFISGIRNSDYDLLEELMDDELRQEIGELSSDDETYHSQTVIVSKVTKDNANNINSLKKLTSDTELKQGNSKSVLHTKRIICEPLKQPNLKSLIKCNTNTTIIDTSLKEGDCINNEGVNIPKLSSKPQTAQIPNVIQPLPSTSVNQQSYNNKKKTVTTQVSVADTSSLYVTTVPQTTKLQNVVLIDPGLVYNQYNRLQVQETQVNVNLYNVSQSPYLAINTPNITLYQSTQFAAPIVNPVIIGNVLSSSVPSTSIEASHTVQDALTAQPIINKQPDMVKIVKAEKKRDSILDKHQLDNPKLTTHLNVISKIPTGQHHADKPTNLVDNSNKINVVQNTLSNLNVEKKIISTIDQRLHIDVNPKVESKTTPDLNSSKNCERKVLSQVQEKQKLSSSQKDDSKNVKNRTILTEAEIKKDTLKDQERLQKKRLAIINRKTDHCSCYPPIPLFYTPLNTEKLNSNIKKRENVLESKYMSKNEEDKMDELKTIKFGSSIHEAKTVMYKNTLVSEVPKENIGDESNSANTNSIQTNTQSDFEITVPNLSNENCKENKDTSQCQRILLRSSNKLKDKVKASIINTKNTVGRKTKVRLKATTNNEDADKDRNINKDKDGITQLKCISKRRRNKKIITKKSLSKFLRKNDLKPVSEKLKTATERHTPPVNVQRGITELKCIDIEEELIGSKIPKYQPNIVKTIVEETTGSQKSEPLITPTAIDINEHTSENNQHEKRMKCVKNQTNNPNCKHINDNNSQKVKIRIKTTENIKATLSKQELPNSVSEEFTSELKALDESVQNMIQKNTKRLDIGNDNVTNVSQDNMKNNNKVEENVLFLKNRSNKNYQNISAQKALNQFMGHDKVKSFKSIQSTNKNLPQDHIKSNNEVDEKTLFLKNRDNKNDQNISTQQALNQLVEHNKDKSIKNIQTKNTNKLSNQSRNTNKRSNVCYKKRNTKEENQLTPEVQLIGVNENNIDKSNHETPEKENNDQCSFGSASSIPQSYKDRIKIIELPNNNDPFNKKLRIQLPNGNLFKATVTGHINSDLLYSHPSFRSFVSRGLTGIKEFTFNQNLEADKINIKTDIKKGIGYYDVAVNKPQSKGVETNYKKPQSDVETINLISDDEDDDSWQNFNTEFGHFKIKSIKEDIFMKHQRMFDLRSFIKLKRCNSNNIDNNDIKTKNKSGIYNKSIINYLNKGLQIDIKAKQKNEFSALHSKDNTTNENNTTILEHGSDFTEVKGINDRTSNDNVTLSNTNSCDAINAKITESTEKINELRDLILQELGAEVNSQGNIPIQNISDFQHKEQPPSQKETTVKKYSNQDEKFVVIDNKKCQLKLTKCDDNIKNYKVMKILNKECFVKLVRCDDLVQKMSQSILPCDDILEIDNESNVETEFGVESAEIGDSLSRCGSYSILNNLLLYEDEAITSIPIVSCDRSSPVMETFDIIASLHDTSDNIFDSAQSSAVLDNLSLIKCNSDWLSTKHELYLQNLNETVEFKKVNLTDYKTVLIPMEIFDTIPSLHNISDNILDSTKSSDVLNNVSEIKCDSEWFSTKHELYLQNLNKTVEFKKVNPTDYKTDLIPMEIFDTIPSLHNISDNILDSTKSSDVLNNVSEIKCDSEWFSTKHELYLQNLNKTVEFKKVNPTDYKTDLIPMEIFDTIPSSHNISDNIIDSTKSSDVLNNVSEIKCDSEWFSTKHELYLQNLNETVEFKKVNLTDYKTDLIPMVIFDTIPSLHKISNNILDSTKSSDVLKNVSEIKCDSEWFSTKQELSLLYVYKTIESIKVKLTDCKSNLVTIDVSESEDDISICDRKSTEFLEVPKLVTIMTTFFEKILKPINKISKQPSRNLKRKLPCTNEYELSKLRATTLLGKFGQGTCNIDIKRHLIQNPNYNEALKHKTTETMAVNHRELIRNDVKNPMLETHTNDIQSKIVKIVNYQKIENVVKCNYDTTENELLNNIASKDSTDENNGKNITVVTINTTTCPNECNHDLNINNDVMLDLKNTNLNENSIGIITPGKENRILVEDVIGTNDNKLSIVKAEINEINGDRDNEIDSTDIDESVVQLSCKKIENSQIKNSTKMSAIENNTFKITTKDLVYENIINKEELTGNKADKKISKIDVATAYHDENKTSSLSHDTITKNGNREKYEKNINDIDDNNIKNIIRMSLIENNFTPAVNVTHLEKNESDNNGGIEENSKIMYEDDCGVVLQGIEYDDPVEGACYFFPLENSNEVANTDDVFKVDEDVSVVHNEIKNYLYEDQEVELKVIAPKTTYSKGNMKRKTNMKDIKIPEKKYRKGKNIDYPKFTSATVHNSSYTKEYKFLFDYCSSLKFSYSRPFHKEAIETSEIIKDWPIKTNHVEVQCKNIEIDDTLFDDFEIRNRTIIVDPLNQTLAEELNAEYKETDGVTLSGNISETNFSMGFGEGSGRVIQNLEDGDDISKFSAATLSDVKQSQPFLLSEDYDYENDKNIPLVSDQQIEKIKRYANCIQLREKVRSFFKKTSYELNYDKYLKSKYRGSKFDAFDLCSSEFIEPYPIETIVQVVQVGQLPVSAAAQNPVTCDPRVTQVSDASPSQCSAENSPRDDSQSAIKTEYTELTTADLSLPLVQEFTQQNQTITVDAHDTTSMPMTDQNIPIEMEIKAETKSDIKNERNEIKDQNNSHDKRELQSMPAINNIEYSYESNDTNTSLESEPSVQIMFNSSEQQSSSENCSQQKQHNGSTEKTDQIAHAMNAAGITTTTETLPNNRAHALVNILSQKIRQGSVSTTQSSTNNYPKTSINAMALQQALAQILPPPLNQTNATDTNQQAQSASVTPQVLHIVQGKNATGNQITLVDNTQQSVISTPNAQVLHIVQNKSNTTGPTCNGNSAPQSNAFSGLSLVDAGLQQGGNQLLHIVNTGNQKNNNTGQLLKRVNLLTNLTNVQGSNEQKMVQFVCKSADGKAIQLNASHQRSMVLRLQPIESPNVQTTQQKPVDSQDLSPTASTTNSVPVKETVTSQQEIKSRSVYEENYAKFIQNSSSKPTAVEKSTSLPKFNQAFGKPVFQDGNQKQNEINTNNTHLPTVNTNSDNAECQSNDNAINLEHIGQISSPPLLLRKSSAQTSQAQPNLVQQIKQTIAPMNIQTMHGGVIYTRQIPVNIGGGQTINLITVPSTELIDDSAQKQQPDVKFVNQNEIEPSIIKIVPQSQTATNADVSTEEGNNHIGVTNENTQNTQPQPVLTQMRIKLPMLSKTPQMVPGARVVRPSFFQIQRNVIGGANQPVYQQLVLTAAPPLGQQTIRLPQTQTNRQIKVPTETQSSSESQMSSSTLEQLREFDMVLEQVKERSTVQPNTSTNNSYSKIHASSSDTTDSAISASSTESTQQVLYSIGNNQPLNVAYVNKKATVTTPTTSTYVRSPDSSGIADSPTSSTHVQLPHTVTSDSSPSDAPSQPKQPKVGSKSKSRPKSSSNPPNSMKINTVPPKTSVQKPLEDEQTTQRILYILAEYKEQVENSPDKDKPAPRRRSNPPSNPSGSSKRKKSSSGSRRPGVRDLSPVHGDDTCRTMGSEDSSCGTSQGDCTESCLESHSPQDSPRKVARKLTYEQDTSATQPRPQPQRNVIVADGQTITVARGTAGKPATAVLMPANYILPVSMVKGGQQIAIVTNRGPKLLTVGGGEGGATNALLLQRLIGPAGLKPVLARPGVRHVRLPTAALHNLQAFNLATNTTVHPPDSTASPAPAPTPELVETRATSSPWTDREAQDVKPERGSSPEGSEPWNLPSSADPHDYTYEETVRADNMDRTVLVVQKKDGSSQRQHRLTHVSAAALRHKYAILEHELRLQKSLSEECEDLGVDSPSASELFPEAELLFAASPAHDHTQDHGHHSHTPQPTLLSQSSSIPQPDIDDQIATDQLIPRDNINERQDLNLGLEDVGIVTVSEDGMQATIALDQEEFARSHPNTTFHSEPTDDGDVQPFTISGLKGRHITSTIFHSNSAPATVLMTAPQTTVISQATAETSNSQNTVKYSDIDNMINLPGTHGSDINLSSVLVKDDGLTRFDSILTDSRELHLSNTASAIVHSGANATQVIRRVCYEDDKRERDTRFLMDEPDALIAGDDAKMIAEDSSRDATLESIAGDVDDDRSSPERHAELFWESNSASERSESRRPLDFSSDSDKCCKSPSYDETNSTDSSGVGTHMRMDSVIKEARGRERSRSADGSSADDTHPPLRTYPPKRLYHPLEGELERSMSGKTRAGERSPDSLEVRRRASGRGVVKRGCHCCNGSPAPPRPKKSRQKKPTMDFSTNN